jgi:hypothetical protein
MNLFLERKGWKRMSIIFLYKKLLLNNIIDCLRRLFFYKLNYYCKTYFIFIF